MRQAVNDPCTLQTISSVLRPGSAELTSYLAGVYGDADASLAAEEWRWHRVDIVWLRLLPEWLREACHDRWPRSPIGLGPGAVYRASGSANCGSTDQDQVDVRNRPCESLWVYRHAHTCSGDRPEFGGVRGLPVERHAGWVEVTHTFSGYFMERSGLWMYVARGSGLWYNASTTLVVSDAVDLARSLNLSLIDPVLHVADTLPGRKGVSKLRLIEHVKRLLPSRGVNTVQFKSHVDLEASVFRRLHPRCSFAFFKDELLSLRVGVRLSCPPTPETQWAWGWKASRRGCKCKPTSRPRPSKDPRLNETFAYGRAFPYWHVECDVSPGNKSVHAVIGRNRP